MKNNKNNRQVFSLADLEETTQIHAEQIKTNVKEYTPKKIEHPSVKFLREYGGNNGLAHSDNHAHYQGYIYNNFAHRSEQEVMMHKALYEMNIRIAKEKGHEYSFFYMPLPVAECLNKKRVEFDFFVVINGYCFGIEVDGDSHNEKSHFDEERRLYYIKSNGIDIYRVRPNEKNNDWANDWLDSTFKIIKRKTGKL